MKNKYSKNLSFWLNPPQARRNFEEMALLWGKDFIVHLVVHIDESGTHDRTGSKPGSREATIGGLIAPYEEWARFCEQWQAVLNKYKASYFHFTDWSAASSVIRNKKRPTTNFQKNPYRHLSAKELNDFIIELAIIAGGGDKQIVGSYGLVNRFHDQKLTGEVLIGSNPYEFCINTFFTTFTEDIDFAKPSWKGQPVSFVFEQTDECDYLQAVNVAFLAAKKRHPNFCTLAFGDKKTSYGLPLQAADMVAYRTRQITGKWIDEDASVQWPELDNALFKSCFDFFAKNKKTVFDMFLAGQLNPPKFRNRRLE